MSNKDKSMSQERFNNREAFTLIEASDLLYKLNEIVYDAEKWHATYNAINFEPLCAILREFGVVVDIHSLGQDIITTENFFDCDCDHNFIHNKEQERYCPTCGIHMHEYPDSRLNEVVDMLNTNSKKEEGNSLHAHELKKLSIYLERLERDAYFMYKSINGGFAEAIMFDYDDDIIDVELKYGIQSDCENVVHTKTLKILRSTMLPID